MILTISSFPLKSKSIKNKTLSNKSALLISFFFIFSAKKGNNSCPKIILLSLFLTDIDINNFKISIYVISDSSLEPIGTVINF